MGFNLATNGHELHEFTRTGTDKQSLSMQPNILQKVTHPSEFPSWEGCRGGFPVAYKIVSLCRSNCCHYTHPQTRINKMKIPIQSSYNLNLAPRTIFFVQEISCTYHKIHYCCYLQILKNWLYLENLMNAG